MTVLVHNAVRICSLYKVNLCLCLINYHTMKMYGGVEVWHHHS
jgi:hypothetical protein